MTNLIVDAYHDRMLVSEQEMVMEKTAMERIISLSHAKYNKIRYRITGEVQCWYCEEYVIHNQDGSCPNCGEWEIPF